MLSHLIRILNKYCPPGITTGVGSTGFSLFTASNTHQHGFFKAEQGVKLSTRTIKMAKYFQFSIIL